MNAHKDIKNPAYSSIRRVENGWILRIGDDFNQGCGPLAEYVFARPDDLADFICNNFHITDKEGNQ